MAAQKSETGRNDPCPCGSGRKYKQCCAQKQSRMSRMSQIAVVAVIVAITAALVYSFTGERGAQVFDPHYGHNH